MGRIESRVLLKGFLEKRTVSSGWYQLKRAFLRFFGSSAMKVDWKDFCCVALLVIDRTLSGFERVSLVG